MDLTEPTGERMNPRDDAEALIVQASEIAGLPNIPDPNVATATARMLEAIARLPQNAAERRAAGLAQLRDTLLMRLKYLEDERRFPAILEERIERPLIAMGFPRSGTSLFHSLISVDPANRSPRWWEVARPSPPVGLAAENDPRRAQGDADERDFVAAMPPEVLAAHPYYDEGGETLIECERLAWLEFLSFAPSAFWKVPIQGNAVLGVVDAKARLAAHRRFLQHLQYQAPSRRWALKGTAHHLFLGELRKTYPDGALVWLHRDPRICFASGMKLISLVMQGILGEVDKADIGRNYLQSSRIALTRSLSSPVLDDPGLYHLRYADFIKDPVGAIRQVYDRFDLPFTEAAEGAMRHWLAANAGSRYGKFHYSFEEFGLSVDDVEREFADYIERFDIPRE